jgi:hypothetical protein
MVGDSVCELKHLSRARYRITCLLPPFGDIVFWYTVHLTVFSLIRTKLSLLYCLKQVLINVLDG